MVGLGRALVLVGVAVWPVWGVLFLSGSAPNVGYALLAHLALVVPGGILVRRGAPPGPRPARKRLGDALIVFGVLAWVPYFILREQGVDTPSTPFLIWHLMGVIPGSILRYTRWRGRRPARSQERRGLGPAIPEGGRAEARAGDSGSCGSGSARRLRVPPGPPP